MKKIVITAAAVLALVTPFAASAHQMATYKIGNSTYQIVIGSLNEPIVVDDKTGLDLTITKCATSACSPTMGDDGDMDGPAGPAVTGLEDSLKLELNAGGQKKILAITPAYGAEGSYRAPYYFTVPTTVSYRLFGEINKTPVDLSFTCVPAGTPHGMEDKTSVKISDGVTQMSNMGGFGCPMAKEGMGFPEQSASVLSVKDSASSAKSMSVAALALAIVALASVGVIRRKKD